MSKRPMGSLYIVIHFETHKTDCPTTTKPVSHSNHLHSWLHQPWSDTSHGDLPPERKAPRHLRMPWTSLYMCDIYLPLKHIVLQQKTNFILVIKYFYIRDHSVSCMNKYFHPNSLRCFGLQFAHLTFKFFFSRRSFLFKFHLLM